jgi:transcriptional regulator with XRE-family HTH domain
MTKYSREELMPDLADRLKSLRVSGVSIGEMASFQEVHRNTVSSWINGHARPMAANLRLWAERTPVPYVWLRDGEH